MVDADVRIIDRRFRHELSALRGVETARIAAGEEAHEARDVLVGTGEPILQGEEIGPQVLRGSRDEAQNPGQTTDHVELTLAAGLRSLAAAAQLFKEVERAALRSIHVQSAEPGQLHDGRGRHAADDGIARIATRLEIGKDRVDVFRCEQHRRDDDVSSPDGSAAGIERARIAPGDRRVKADLETGHVAAQHARCTLGRAGQMRVQSDDDHPQGGAFSDRSGLWHRTMSRG